MTSLNPVLTIGRQLEEVLRAHLGLKGAAAEARSVELLASVGIPSPRERLGNYPHQFSGGMRQRAMIAMALACEPALVIADEPTTALDVTVQAQILRLLKRLVAERDTALVLITHDLGVVAGTCRRVLVMYGGTIVEEGSARDVFHEPRHPYTLGLLQSVPRLDSERRSDLRPIEGAPPHLASELEVCPFHPRCERVHPSCREALPSLTPVSDGHRVACVDPLPAGAAAGLRHAAT
jgi:oligopeptide transport system ATP-binding protein